MDLTAVYDTINHRLVLYKLYKIIHDFEFVKLTKSLLSDKRFFVTLDNNNSQLRILEMALWGIAYLHKRYSNMFIIH